MRKIQLAAWIHRSDWEGGVVSLTKQIDIFHEVCPTWFRPNIHSGEIEVLQDGHTDDLKFQKTLQENRIALFPLLYNVSFNHKEREVFRANLQKKHFQKMHAQAITDLVTKHNYNGIDLDYEGFSPRELVFFVEIIEELHKTLQSHNKHLAVCLQPMGGRRVRKYWKRISSAADFVRIMAYDQHYSGSDPGPIASLVWVQNILKEALRSVPQEKLVLGVPLYGRRWGAAPGSGTYEDLITPYIQNNVPFRRDPKSMCPFIEHENDIIWFEDAESVRQKIELAYELGVRRFIFWRLGGEDPDVWHVLREHFIFERK